MEEIKKAPGEWEPVETTYKEGDQVTYDGQEYVCKGAEAETDLGKELIKGVRKERILEKCWWFVIIFIGLSVIGWSICGRWVEALCCSSWLFVGWMYRRRQKALVVATEMMLDLGKKNSTQEKIIKCYEEMAFNYKKMVKIQEELIAHRDENIKSLKKYIDIQEDLIKTLQEWKHQ